MTPASGAPPAEVDAPATESPPAQRARMILSGPLEGDLLPPGTQIGNYVIQELLGRGGCAHVYGVASNGGELALKLLFQQHVGTEMEIRFLREVRAVKAIAHPSIVDISEVGRLEDGRSFFVMERLRGKNLREVLRSHGCLSLTQVVEILEQISNALEAAHAAGIVHRDIKSSNIVLVAGPNPRVKLLDFGIAKFLRPEFSDGLGATQRGVRIGSAHFMAPEQIRGDPVDIRADIYALGVLIFQLLTGQLPFRGQGDELDLMHLHAAPPRPSALSPLPAAVDDVVLRCLAKSPEARFPSTKALLNALRSAALELQPEPPKGSGEAVGIALEITWDPTAADEATLLIDLADALDAAERRLRQANFQIGIRSMSMVLALKILPSAEPGRREWLRAADALGRAILGDIPAQRGFIGQSRVHVGACEIADEQVTGGPILYTETWPTMPSPEVEKLLA